MASKQYFSSQKTTQFLRMGATLLQQIGHCSQIVYLEGKKKSLPWSPSQMVDMLSRLSLVLGDLCWSLCSVFLVICLWRTGCSRVHHTLSPEAPVLTITVLRSLYSVSGVAWMSAMKAMLLSFHAWILVIWKRQAGDLQFPGGDASEALCKGAEC